METERDWTCVHAISSDPPVIECNVHYIKLPGKQEDIDAFLCEKKTAKFLSFSFFLLLDEFDSL